MHFTDPDSAGRNSGWGSTNYNNSLVAVDGYLGSLFNLVTGSPMFDCRTVIILTADHGGSGTNHSNAPFRWITPSPSTSGGLAR